MYGYEEYIELTPEHILQKVTQEQVFQIVFQQEIITDVTCYTNPLRKDKSPGCWFEYINGKLIFTDFGDRKKTHRGCFSMIMDKYGVNLKSAIKIVCNYYNLTDNIYDYSPIEVREDLEEVEHSKTPLIISFKKKDYTKQDKKFWSKFLIYPYHLEEDFVYSVQSYSINFGKVLTPYSLCYAYTFPENKVKLYQPVGNPKYKWMTNCDNNVIGNIHNISKTGKLLIITKSYKDCRVLRNLGIKDVIWFQNEGQVPSDSIIIDLLLRFEKVIFFYDNDISGIEAAKKLVGIFNNFKKDCASSVWLPLNYSWKDPSDFISKEGRSELHKIAIELGIIT